MRKLHRNKLLVLGVGNLLLKDEGIGIRLVRALEQTKMPAGVKLLDGGTGGLAHLEEIMATPQVLILDAANLPGPPGRMKRVTLTAIAPVRPAAKRSFHQDSIAEVLELAVALEKCPKVIFFGIKPKDISPGMELTPELRAIIPPALKRIQMEIKRLIR